MQQLSLSRQQLEKSDLLTQRALTKKALEFGERLVPKIGERFFNK